MTRTFLVAIDVPDTDPSSLAGTAEDILDELTASGFTVISVKHWDSPDQLPGLGNSLSAQPPSGTQPIPGSLF